MLQAYERGDEEAKTLVRGVVELCLDGFRETYRRVGIDWDSWDWESDIVWSGNVSKILHQLQKTPYVFENAGVLELNAEQVKQCIETVGIGFMFAQAFTRR
jgi:arginyl-tRNA synthetase